jgi:large subunit ribosomal protein L22
MDFEVKAVASYIPISAQKVRLVIDLVRGKRVDEALNILQFTDKAAAGPVAKVIRSATANAEENFGLASEDLYVVQITADEGPRRRWRRFGARGRFKPIIRRSTHITVILAEAGVA